MPTRARLFVRILALATLAFAAFAPELPRGDGWYYYVYLPSVFFDGDLDLDNQYAAHDPYAMRASAATGRKVNVFPPGTAVLWAPFFAAADAASALAGLPRDARRNPAYPIAVSWGTVVYGALALVLAHRVLARWFAPWIAWYAVLGVALATPFAYYWIAQPFMSHVPAAFLLALLADRVLAARDGAGSANALAIGLALGLTISARPANAVAALTVLPAAAALARERSVRGAAALVAGLALGLAPLLVAWRALFGSWLVMPQGAGFVDWTRPALAEFLFSTRRGLLVWSPLLWPALLGAVAFACRTERGPGVALTAAYALAVYVNAAATDWWAAHAFGARRMVDWTLVPMVGLAWVIDAAHRAARADPDRAFRAALAAALAVPVLLCAGMAVAYDVRRIPPSHAIPSTELYGAGFDTWYRAAGNPLAWPAALPFAVEHGVSPARWDVAGGHYFVRHDFSAGDELRFADPLHARYLTRGWAGGGRLAGARGDVALPLYGPGPYRLEIALELDRPEDVAVELAGAPVHGPERLEAGARTVIVRIPAGRTRKGPNRITLAGPGARFVTMRIVDEEPAWWSPRTPDDR